MKQKLAIISLALLAACSNKREPAAESQEPPLQNEITLSPEQLKNTPITLQTVTAQSSVTNLKVNGVVEVPPQNLVSISAPLGGYVVNTQMLPGMYVKKGQLLATLQDPQYINLQQEYLSTQAQLVYAQAEYSRQQQLLQTQATSQKQFQETQMNYQNLRISKQALSQKLQLIGINPATLSESKISSNITLRAPVSGFISAVNVTRGSYVSPTQVIFELVNTSDIHLVLHVLEKDVHKLRIGQQVMAYNNSRPQQKYAAQIMLIGQTLDANHAVQVHCHFKNYQSHLLPGMFINAELQVPDSSGYVIASESVMQYQGGQYVFYKTPTGSYKLQAVQAQNAEHGQTKIQFPAGFNPHYKQFVVTGAYTLFMALKNRDD